MIRVLCFVVCVQLALCFPERRTKRVDWVDVPNTDNYRNYNYRNDVLNNNDRKDSYNWMPGQYDKEESLVPIDPNGVYPSAPKDVKQNKFFDEQSEEQSGWFSDDEDIEQEPQYTDLSSSSSDEEGQRSSEESYDADLDYIADDVAYNKDLINDLEDDLDRDEEKIYKMEKKMRKMNKRLKTLQSMVNAFEFLRLSDHDNPRRNVASPNAMF